jgi:hypothetical protein
MIEKDPDPDHNTSDKWIRTQEGQKHTDSDPDPQHCLFGGAKAALGGNLLEEAEVGEAVRREAAVEEGYGSGEAVAEGGQLTLLLLVGGVEAGPPLLTQPEKVQIDLSKKKRDEEPQSKELTRGTTTVSSALSPAGIGSDWPRQENRCDEEPQSSVPDPEPDRDPRVLGPPGSGSISERYGSGSGYGSLPFLINVLNGLK